MDSQKQATTTAPLERIVRRRITVVFEVVDESCLAQLYDSHLSRNPVCGGVPAIIASGDQVSIPQDIIEALSGLDPETQYRDAIAILIEQACRFQRDQ